jgi:ATP synthase protein I
MNDSPAHPPAPAATRMTVLPTVLVGAGLVLVSGLAAGWPGVAGAALGTAVVVAFFGLDLLALRLSSGRIPDAPIVLIGLFVLLALLGDSTSIEPLAFGAAAAAGTVIWLIGQIRLVGRILALPTPAAPAAAAAAAPPTTSLSPVESVVSAGQVQPADLEAAP